MLVFQGVYGWPSKNNGTPKIDGENNDGNPNGFGVKKYIPIFGRPPI